MTTGFQLNAAQTLCLLYFLVLYQNTEEEKKWSENNPQCHKSSDGNNGSARTNWIRNHQAVSQMHQVDPTQTVYQYLKPNPTIKHSYAACIWRSSLLFCKYIIPSTMLNHSNLQKYGSVLERKKKKKSGNDLMITNMSQLLYLQLGRSPTKSLHSSCQLKEINKWKTDMISNIAMH